MEVFVFWNPGNWEWFTEFLIEDDKGTTTARRAIWRLLPYEGNIMSTLFRTHPVALTKKMPDESRD